MARHEQSMNERKSVLIAFASLFHSVYHTHFTSITQNEVVSWISTKAIVDAIRDSDGPRALSARQTLLSAPNHSGK